MYPNTNENEGASDESYQKHDDKPTDSYPNDYHTYEFSETRKVLEDFFSPQQHQQLQQQKLLEFQQRSKRQQVEKVLPLDDLVNFDSAPQSSASYIGQRFAALKQIQQKQHYEHQLQQQYENRRIIEEAEDAKPSFQLHENIIAEEDLEEQNFYAYNNPFTNFTMSPETTDYESNCEDLDSEFSLRYLCSDPSLSSEANGTVESGRSFSSIAMPVLEDGLSSEHESDTENNNADVTSILSAQNHPPGKDENQIVENETITQAVDNCEADEASNNNIYASKESISSGNAQENKIKTDEEEADTDLETDRLLGQQRMNEIQAKVTKSGIQS